MDSSTQTIYRQGPSVDGTSSMEPANCSREARFWEGWRAQISSMSFLEGYKKRDKTASPGLWVGENKGCSCSAKEWQ